MNVIIVEDEPGVAQNLLDLLQEVDSDINVVEVLESVKETAEWIESNKAPDLGFFDIRLADGNSLDIFDKVDVKFPVIFTTAYDQYALKAFKVNSIDYLLKPVSKPALEHALNKYRTLFQSYHDFDNKKIAGLISQLDLKQGSIYKKSFLVYVKDKIIPVLLKDIAYFYLEAEQVYCRTLEGERYVIDRTLDNIVSQCDPALFFRANRQVIVSRIAVKNLSQHFNRKLELHLKPQEPYDIVVSKVKATEFKKWLER
jgi:DNA-binding LytR/AlgR family response regulator